MFEYQKFTRTTGTEASYIKQATKMLKDFGDKQGKDWDLEPDSLIAWLEAKRDGVSPSTWRQRRAALGYYMEGIQKNKGLSDRIREISIEGCPKSSRTSANKKKSISDSELMELSNFLSVPESSDISRITFRWLSVGILTGLRPSEWWGSKLTERVDTLELKVQNGKQTNGRSNGPTRTLIAYNLESYEREGLIAHWRLIDSLSSRDQFDLLQRSCSDKMRYASKSLWPRKKKKPSLYSSRHQFLANSKKDRVPLDLMAATVGHGTDRTATEHYGRRMYGSAGRTKVMATEEGVAMVRQVDKGWVGQHQSGTAPKKGHT